MSKRAFTEEEKELLSNNKYVKHVGDRGITYTKDYKIYFLEEKKKGKSAEEIFESAGFDTELLGVKRITSFDSRITRDGVEDRRVGNSGRPRLTKEQIEARLERKKLEKEHNRLKRLEKLESEREYKSQVKVRLKEKRIKERQRQIERLKKRIEAQKKIEAEKKAKAKAKLEEKKRIEAKKKIEAREKRKEKKRLEILKQREAKKRAKEKLKEKKRLEALKIREAKKKARAREREKLKAKNKNKSKKATSSKK